MTLISLMCHPEREPAISVSGDCFVNREKGYGNAVRSAIAKAIAKSEDLIVADSDGYHPVEVIERLASRQALTSRALFKPFRTNMGFQSRAFASFYSFVKGTSVLDPTGGLWRMSLGLMTSLPELTLGDSSVNVEIVNKAIAGKAELVQYGFEAGQNDVEQSTRPVAYQLKLLRAML